MRATLLAALRQRRDPIALEILREHPHLIDEEIIGAALDNGCVKVIRYLREHDLITACGREEREHLRRKNRQQLLDALNDAMPGLEEFFNGSKDRP